jgi:hypothetical protein
MLPTFGLLFLLSFGGVTNFALKGSPTSQLPSAEMTAPRSTNPTSIQASSTSHTNSAVSEALATIGSLISQLAQVPSAVLTWGQSLVPTSIGGINGGQLAPTPTSVTATVSESSSSEPNPSPMITSVTYPTSLVVGQTATITVTATNNGGTSAWQTISISFPTGTMSEISIAGSSLGSSYIEPPGTSWSACYSLCTVILSYPLAEGVTDGWTSGQSNFLSVNVTPTTAGAFSFYVKTVASGLSDNDVASNWDPTSGTTDQQNEFVYTKTIQVISPTTTSESCIDSTISVGTSTTCTASVSGQSPTGTITWSQTAGTGSVTFPSTTCTLSSGSCSVQVTGSDAGSVTIRAAYGGNGNNAVSSGTANLVVTPAPTRYLVQFLAAGLTNIYTWSVTLNGVQEMSNGPGNTYADIGFQDVAAGGPYIFTVGAPSGLYACPAAGVVEVSGNTEQQIDFQTSPCAVTYVIQPISATFSSTYGGSTQEVQISGCSPSSSSIPGDGNTYDIVMTESCPFTLSLPSGYNFVAESGGTTCTIVSCPAFITSYEANAPTLSTSSSLTSIPLPSIQTVYDTATVTGGLGPLAGSVSFALYYNDPTCTSTPIYTDDDVALTVTSGTGMAFSGAELPPEGWEGGIYYWGASFSLTSSSSIPPILQCGGTGETLTVSAETPTLSTRSSLPVIILPDSQTVTDTATLSGSLYLAGTVNFTLYQGSSCSVVPIFTENGVNVKSGSATSEGAIPSSGWAAGMYTWAVSFTSNDSSDNSIPMQCGGPGELVTVSTSPDYIGNDNAEFTTCSIPESQPLCSTPSYVTAELSLTSDLNWQGRDPAVGESTGSEITMQYNPDGFESIFYQSNAAWFQTAVQAEEKVVDGQPLSCFSGTVQIRSTVNYFAQLIWEYFSTGQCIPGGFDAQADWQIREQVDSSTDDITGVNFTVTTSDGGSWNASCSINSACVGDCYTSTSIINPALTPITCGALPSGYVWLKSNICMCSAGGTAAFGEATGTLSYSSNVKLYPDVPPSEQLDDAVATAENSNAVYGCMSGKASSDMSQSFGLTGECIPPSTYFILTSDSPVNLLVTNPNGNEAGFEANGTQVNNIAGATLVGPCSTQYDRLVNITIPSPVPGQYQISIFPSCAEPGGSPYTINVQGPNGTGTYSGTAYQGGGTQEVFVQLSTSGQVTVSSSSPTGVPEFPGGFIALVAVMAVLFAYLKVYKLNEFKLRTSSLERSSRSSA